MTLYIIENLIFKSDPKLLPGTDLNSLDHVNLKYLQISASLNPVYGQYNSSSLNKGSSGKHIDISGTMIFFRSDIFLFCSKFAISLNISDNSAPLSINDRIDFFYVLNHLLIFINIT